MLRPARRPESTHPPRKVPSSDPLPWMPPPPKPAASPTAYSPGMGCPSAERRTRHRKSVWIPPRLLRLKMNSRIAISGRALGSRIFWNLQRAHAVAAILARIRDAAQLIVVGICRTALDHIVPRAHGRLHARRDRSSGHRDSCDPSAPSVRRDCPATTMSSGQSRIRRFTRSLLPNSRLAASANFFLYRNAVM